MPTFTFRRCLLLCLPALLIGGWLRVEMLNGWRGGFYFGPDSGSYWENVFRFMHGGHLFTTGKRPWMYPLIVWLASHGPVSPAFSVALVQHLVAWLSIVVLGALVRAVLPWAQWFMVPVTTLYAVQPEILYWGHVLIADSLFISTTLAVALAVALYWQKPHWRSFAIVIALVFPAMALRPVGRTLWIGFFPIVLLVRGVSWRTRALHTAALAILYFPASKATAVTQGEDLLFVSTLPLMRLDTPLHADLKAELRPQVEAARADLWSYIAVGQRQVWGDLIDDDPADPGSVLQTLRKDKKRYSRVRHEISREALRSSPVRYAGMVVMKMFHVYSINDTHTRLEPNRWREAGEKFLGTSFRKIGAKFPAFVLRDRSVVDENTLHVSLEKTLVAAGSQTRVLRALNFFGAFTTPFDLRGKMPDRWWWIVPVALGVFVFSWTREGRRLLPVILFSAAYLGMTFIVGRAVGRYRLPVEFALHLTAAAGLATLPALFRKRGAANPR